MSSLLQTNETGFYLIPEDSPEAFNLTNASVFRAAAGQVNGRAKPSRQVQLSFKLLL